LFLYLISSQKQLVNQRLFDLPNTK
jgi:hypothetical protein